MLLRIKLWTHARLDFFERELTICIKMDLALNNLQRLISHKTQPTDQAKYNDEESLAMRLAYMQN